MSSAQCSMSSAQCSMSTAQCSMSTAQCSNSLRLIVHCARQYGARARGSIRTRTLSCIIRTQRFIAVYVMSIHAHSSFAPQRNAKKEKYINLFTKQSDSYSFQTRRIKMTSSYTCIKTPAHPCTIKHSLSSQRPFGSLTIYRKAF